MGFIHLSIIDVIDIAVAATIMYYIYKLTRGTYAPSILTGIILIYLLSVVVKALHMELLSMILGQIVGVGAIALIVVFQPEIRRFLHHLGATGRQRRDSFLGRLIYADSNRTEYGEYAEAIVRACSDMAHSHTGALVVIRRQDELASIIETGIRVDARLSSPLLKNLFFKNSPLHDGAVVVSGGRILAAKCILPTTESEVPVSFGMRHRAALGASEVTDALVVAVSEEQGTIAVARAGKITCAISPEQLKTELLNIL